MRLVDRIATINPQHITQWDVKFLFGKLMPLWAARQILKTGARRGDFAVNEDGSYRLVEEPSQR